MPLIINDSATAKPTALGPTSFTFTTKQTPTTLQEQKKNGKGYVYEDAQTGKETNDSETVKRSKKGDIIRRYTNTPVMVDVLDKDKKPVQDFMESIRIRQPFVNDSDAIQQAGSGDGDANDLPEALQAKVAAVCVEIREYIAKENGLKAWADAK